MQVTMNKQDLQGAMEYAKNRIIERLVSKSDVQGACDNARDRIIINMNSIHQQQQQYLRQSITQADQHARRGVIMETRLAALEQESRNISQLLARMLDEQRRLTSLVSAMPKYVVKTSAKEVEKAQDRPQYGVAY